jgi:hypothetical protein
LKLNAKSLDSLDVEERPPPTVKQADDQDQAQLLATYKINGEPTRAYSCKRNEIACHIGEAK